MERAQHHAFTRKYRAVDAEPDATKRATMRAQFDIQHKAWFFSRLAQSFTEQVQLVEDCLDNLRTRAKRTKRAGCAGCAGCAPQIDFLPREILESAALAPFLERWRRHYAAPAACASAPEPRARCTYPTMDQSLFLPRTLE